jgi:DNA-damage-inducible protein J
MNGVVRARLDQKLKDEAEAVLEAIGLTTSDAVRMMMIRIAREKKLPFEPIIPNARTVAAIKAARAGNTIKVGRAKDLLAGLNADD